jgi:uncharacterized protein DUF2795
MERGNKRSPRIDDEMTRETGALVQSGQSETHTQESLIKEGLLPGEQPRVGAPGVYDTRRSRPGDDEIEARSELARWLEPHLFPADRADLADRVRERGAPDDVVDLVERLPERRRFPNVEAVWEAVGGRSEHRG